MVLVTAPSAHPVFGVPERLVDLGYVPNQEAALERHARYNQIVREVSGSTGADLLDLDALFAGAPPARLGQLFRSDGIHFNQAGLQQAASHAAAEIGRRVPR